MRGRIWRIEDVLREEGAKRKFGTTGSIVLDGCCAGVMFCEHLARGPTHRTQ